MAWMLLGSCQPAAAALTNGLDAAEKLLAYSCATGSFFTGAVPPQVLFGLHMCAAESLRHAVKMPAAQCAGPFVASAALEGCVPVPVGHPASSALSYMHPVLISTGLLE